MGQVNPQQDPELFTDAAIMKEIKYLIKSNERYGTNDLRTMAYLKLMHFIEDRKAKTGSRKTANEFGGVAPHTHPDGPLCSEGWCGSTGPNNWVLREDTEEDEPYPAFPEVDENGEQRSPGWKYLPTASRKTATAAGYYLVGYNGGIVEGP